MNNPTDQKTIIMYGTPSCPMVPPMKGLLNRSQIDYDYINIMNDLEARQRVQAINNGYESVPTFIFPDGSTLTEPSAGEMKKKLQELGYDVPLSAMLMGNMWLIFVAVAIGFALLRAFGIF
ncbi:MAG: glutaredoxin domain-containing protein [Phototrophicaceae bacterium]